ncbi:MAG TPA: hypothetical protein VGM14_12175 [Streptosporangiaceae bacterium]
MFEPETAPSQPQEQRTSPRWQLRIEPDGTLAAETTGYSPPHTVTGETLASLRRQTRDLAKHRRQS